MGDTKLKACPFCGGVASISVDPEAASDSMGRLWAFTVVCDRCCATSGLSFSRDMAAAAWNKRVSTVEQPRWIPVKERLPEKLGTYIVSSSPKIGEDTFGMSMQEYGAVFFNPRLKGAKYDDIDENGFVVGVRRSVTHWLDGIDLSSTVHEFVQYYEKAAHEWYVANVKRGGDNEAD